MAASGVALAGLIYGFLLQPSPADPFAAPESAVMRWLSPMVPVEVARMDVRPMAPPATGWAPRAWQQGAGARWLPNRGALQILPERQEPVPAIWGDPDGALLGADGRLYQDGQAPVEARATDAGTWNEVYTLTGHEDAVSRAAFSPDGARVVTASEDGTARIWDAESGTVIGTLISRKNPVWSAAFSSDGARVVTASEDGTARVWDAESGTVIHNLIGHKKAALTAAFSSDGTRVVTASSDRTARIWDAATGMEIVTLIGHQDWVRSAAFSADGASVVTAGEEGTARIWDAATGKAILILPPDGGIVTSAAFSPDGTRVVTASGSHDVRLWDAATGRAIHTLTGHKDIVFSAAFSPDGARVVTASEDGTARVWDAGTGMAIHTLAGHDDVVRSAAFSPDGARVVTASDDRTARIWQLGQLPIPRSGVRIVDEGVCLVDLAGWACNTVPTSLARLSLHEVAAGGPVAVQPVTVVKANQAAQQQVYLSTALTPAELPELAIPATVFAATLASDRVIAAGENGTLIASDLESGVFTLLRPQVAGESLNALRIEGETLWVAGTRPRSLDPLVVAVRFIGRQLGVASVAPEPAREVVLLKARLRPIGETLAFAAPRFAPAPWAFAWAVPSILLLSYSGVAVARGGPRVRQGIAGAPLADTPIGWNDADVLGVKPIARALSRFIRNVETRPPLTIAITGGWGTGKSSLMNLLQQDLRRYRARPVWFNAWHHRQEEHLLASLLSAIRRQLVPPFYTFAGLWFRLRLLWHRTPRLRLAIILLLLTLALFAAVVALADRGGFERARSSLDAWLSAPEAASNQHGKLQGLLGSETFKKLLTFLGFSIPALLALRKMVPIKVDPAKLLSDLRSRASVREFREKLSFRDEFATAFAEVCAVARTRRNPGVVILVDDLDRCPPDAVLSVMEAMNYLMSSGACVVILGIDRDQIEHAVGLGFKDIVDGLPDRELGRHFVATVGADETTRTAAKRRAYARRYLEKLINIEISVPKMDPEDAQAMLFRSTTPEQEPFPAWYRRWKPVFQTAINWFQVVALAVVVALAAGLIASVMLEAWYPQAVERREVIEPAATPAAVTPSPEVEAPVTEATEASVEATPLRLRPSPWLGESSNFALWWIGSVVLLLLSGMLLGLGLLRRRGEVEKDSDIFAETLREVAPIVHEANPTPRAIKLFENRMRYMAARVDADDNPYRPDAIDRLFRSWLDPAFFQRHPSSLGERSLVLIGAESFIKAAGGEVPRSLRDAIAPGDRKTYEERWA